MKILVAGGTGFIGSAIVEELLKNPSDQVSVLSRHPRDSTRVRSVKGDVTRLETLKDVGVGIDCVIICVQFPNHPVQNYRRGWTYENYDARGTENLIEAIKGSGVKRIIYISGAGTRPEKTEPWFRAKVRAENAIKSLGSEYVIFRPSLIYGEGDRAVNRFVTFAKYLPVMPVIGDGRGRLAPLYVKDMAQAVSIAIRSETAKNKTIEIGGPENLTMNEVQKTVLEVLEKNKPLVHHPLWMMKAAGHALSAALPQAPLSAEAVDFITMDVPIDNRAAEKILGMKFRNFRTTLRTYAK